MGTLVGGFPNPPALWLRRAKLAFANAVLNGNPRWGLPKPSRALAPPSKARLRQRGLEWEPSLGFPNPPALWLRRAKLAFANAVLNGNPRWASQTLPRSDAERGT